MSVENSKTKSGLEINVTFVDWLRVAAIEKDTAQKGDETGTEYFERMQKRHKLICDYACENGIVKSWDFVDANGKNLDPKKREDYNALKAADYQALYNAWASALNPT